MQDERMGLTLQALKSRRKGFQFGKRGRTNLVAGLAVERQLNDAVL
jgi:hypothetical protein